MLPFSNLSGDPNQDYLSDGITEDVISGLSRFSDLSVIARNSSFSYKGRSVDVREAGRQLGVRYLVEGSVRRFDDRIRITAQLVDAQSGVQRWGERFDRALGDVFSVQDEITRSIVAIVVAHLSNAEIERVSRKPAGSWTAYDLTLRGDRAQTLAEQYWDAKYVYEARRLYAEALRIDPENSKICAKLGHTYVRAYADPTSPDLGSQADLKHGFNFARQAVGLDPNAPLARAQLGWAYAWMRQSDAAIAEFEKAMALNSSFVDYRFPLILTFAGEPERALGVERDYVRLDPFYGSMLPVIRGIALYMLERYPEALGSASRMQRSRATCAGTGGASGYAAQPRTARRSGGCGRRPFETTASSHYFTLADVFRFSQSSRFRRNIHGLARVRVSLRMGRTVLMVRPLCGCAQRVIATHWLNRSAGVWKSSVFLGRSLSWRATLLRPAWE